MATVAPAGNLSFRCRARPSVALRTLYTFIRLSPAPSTPRRPAVPKDSS